MTQELLHYFTLWTRIMTLEAIVCGFYMFRCLAKQSVKHRLFLVATICFFVLLGEIFRASGMLRGWLEYHPKDVYVFSLEMLPFGWCAYEICKKIGREIYYKFRLAMLVAS